MTDADRSQFIGGTDAAAIAGLSPWTTPMDVWMEKTGRMVNVLDNEIMYWGREIEPIIANRYAADTGRDLRDSEPLSHVFYPWAGGHPDRLIYPDQGILEIKTAGLHMRNHWGDAPYGDVPQQYYIQVQWYMWLTGFQWADIAVLIGGQDYRVYYVPRNDSVIDRLVNICGDFWENNVLKDIPPELDAKAGTKKYLASIQRDTDTIGSTAMAEDWARNYRIAKGRAEHWKQEVELAKHNLIREIGSHKTMESPNWKATVSNRKDGVMIFKFTDRED